MGLFISTSPTWMGVFPRPLSGFDLVYDSHMNVYLADMSDRPRLVVRTGRALYSATWTDPGPPARQLLCQADTPEEALGRLIAALAKRGVAPPDPEFLES